jgi:arginine/lysine/ornithine decarboxylase
MVADVEGCARSPTAPACRSSSTSRGARTSASIPTSRGALAQGADAMLTSTHKMVGSLTQSAMLHVADTGRVDVSAVARAIRLLRTTSPSSLLFASLDAARRQLAVHGEALLHDTLRVIAQTREKMASSPGISVVGPELVGRPGVVDWDPMRIVLDVRATGRTGYEVAEALRVTYDAHVELATQATVLLIIGIAEEPAALVRLGGDLDEVAKRIGRPGTTPAVIAPPASLEQQMAVAPRDAFLGEAELVGVDDAVGPVSCESIAGYPPGIPALLPGERSPPRPSPTCARSSPPGRACTARATRRSPPINVLQGA